MSFLKKKKRFKNPNLFYNMAFVQRYLLNNLDGLDATAFLIFTHCISGIFFHTFKISECCHMIQL